MFNEIHISTSGVFFHPKLNAGQYKTRTRLHSLCKNYIFRSSHITDNNRVMCSFRFLKWSEFFQLISFLWILLTTDYNILEKLEGVIRT
jgi:hypothetical protein